MFNQCTCKYNGNVVGEPVRGGSLVKEGQGMEWASLSLSLKQDKTNTHEI